MVKRTNEDAAHAAISRLVDKKPLRAPDARRLDRNLQKESGLARATLYRCTDAMDRWRREKELAVKAALQRFSSERLLTPSRVFKDADLIREAGIDHAALRKMPPNVIGEWEQLKAEGQGRARRRIELLSPDEVIKSLINKLYALTLVVRQRDEQIAVRDKIIAAQAATIERLGGNVVRLPT